MCEAATNVDLSLEPAMAARFARSTLRHLGQEYPNSLQQVVNGPEDALPPSRLHPVFHGSFDWHSCVHGWWQVLRIARRFPDLPEAAEARARADAMLTDELMAGEADYFSRPGAQYFERPYGWAWFLALHDECTRHPGRGWSAALEPLARLIAERFQAYLPKLTYPVRHGVHSNTAFALVLAHDWAALHDPALLELISRRSQAWFEADRDVRPLEPSGEDFLSPTLCEALLMLRVLGKPAFRGWFDQFLPRVPQSLFEPVVVADRTDGRLAHLDGVNLSRAWAWRVIAAALDNERLAAVAETHLNAALPHLADDYAGEHWLATFALLALDG